MHDIRDTTHILVQLQKRKHMIYYNFMPMHSHKPLCSAEEKGKKKKKRICTLKFYQSPPLVSIVWANKFTEQARKVMLELANWECLCHHVCWIVGYKNLLNCNCIRTDDLTSKEKPDICVWIIYDASNWWSHKWNLIFVFGSSWCIRF